MKIQDIIFICLFMVLIVLKKPVWMVWAGSVSLIAAIPLFAAWIFFTGERLTWYSAAFFLGSVLFQRAERKELV